MAISSQSGAPIPTIQDIQDYTLNYYGHGHEDARWIFIGIEEYEGTPSLNERLHHWKLESANSSMNPHLVDAFEKEEYLLSQGLVAKNSHGLPLTDPKRYNYKLFKIITDVEQGLGSSINAAHGERVGRKHNGVIHGFQIPAMHSPVRQSCMLLEILPLPCKSKSNGVWASTYNSHNAVSSLWPSRPAYVSSPLVQKRWVNISGFLVKCLTKDPERVIVFLGDRGAIGARFILAELAKAGYVATTGTPFTGLSASGKRAYKGNDYSIAAPSKPCVMEVNQFQHPVPVSYHNTVVSTIHRHIAQQFGSNWP